MLRWLLRVFMGYMRFTVQTASPARLINKLEEAGIGFWKTAVSGTGMRFCCLMRSAPQVCRLLADAGISEVDIRRYGLPVILSTRVRKVIFAGVVILAVALPLVSGRFLADITVSGNRSVDTEEILQSLEQAGIRTYAYIPRLQLKYGRQQLLLQQPKLSWATLNLTGNVLEVIVHEKNGSDVVLPHTPCNIVAAYDGMICKAEVLAGKQMVRENTAVRKGQLLVSGFSETETGHLSYLHAQATVIAEVELQKSYTVDLSKTDYRPLDDPLVRYELVLFGGRFPLYTAAQLPSQPYTVENTEHWAACFGIQMPFGITKRSYTLYDAVKSTLTEADATAILEQRFAEYECYELEDAVIIAKEHRMQREGTKITMTGEYLVQLDIARKVTIEVAE